MYVHKCIFLDDKLMNNNDTTWNSIRWKTTKLFKLFLMFKYSAAAFNSKCFNMFYASVADAISVNSFPFFPLDFASAADVNVIYIH